MSQRIVCVLSLAVSLIAQDVPKANATALPVKELTAFKDGHAYVLREAPLPKDANGTVVLDKLPQPVLGTFWPFAYGGASVVSAKAGREEVAVKVKAASLLHVARANIGKTVALDLGKEEVAGGELAAVEGHSDQAAILFLQSGESTRAVPLARVRDILVLGKFNGDIGEAAQLDLVHAWGSTARPKWWSWWSWPHWWFHHNGFGECRWNVTLKPGQKVELGAKWHYLWR